MIAQEIYNYRRIDEQVITGGSPSEEHLRGAANFRVSAIYSLYAQKHLGWSEAQADEFRASIWQGSDNPVWEAFIGRMKARTAEPDRS